MGACFYDKEQSHRRLEAIYALATSKGVEKFLNRWDYVLIEPYDKGDYGLIDLIIDMRSALELACLTPKQRKAVQLIYMQGYTQQEVADMQGITQPAVAKQLATATQKIADIFKDWDDYNTEGAE